MLTDELRLRFRDDLRLARSQVQADAEGFEVVVHAIERLGRQFVPDGTGLGQYEPALVGLVKDAGLPTKDLEHRLFLLRQTRNDAVHQGSYARNAAREAVWVALRLEDALSVGWNNIELKYMMVKDAVTTRAGDRLDDVRQAMLEHAFTAIPAFVNGKWYVLTDRWLAAWLVGKAGKGRRKALETAVDSLSETELHGLNVAVLAENTHVSELTHEHLKQPLILVGSPESPTLLGVVAPADLL